MSDLRTVGFVLMLLFAAMAFFGIDAQGPRAGRPAAAGYGGGQQDLFALVGRRVSLFPEET